MLSRCASNAEMRAMPSSPAASVSTSKWRPARCCAARSLSTEVESATEVSTTTISRPRVSAAVAVDVAVAVAVAVPLWWFTACVHASSAARGTVKPMARPSASAEYSKRGSNASRCGRALMETVAAGLA